MYRSKKDVDKHVESLTSRLSGKEFQLRTYSIARLYYEVEDYASCQRYVEQYIAEKSNSAAAYKLLGQALQKLGQKERALEQYKSSLDIDPTQSSLVLDICTILVDKDVTFDPGRAKYWCEKAEATFPKHPVTFQLREKLMVLANPDPEAIIQLLKSELAVRPKDVTLHARLLKHYSQTNKHNEAFEHSFEYEFGNNNFANNYAWYETLGQILKYYTDDKTDWKYQLLLLTVKEKLCALSLTEIPSGAFKGFVESNNLLHDYDQSLSLVAKLGASPGCADFYTALIDHHRSQFVFHLATFLLRKAKKNLLNWREANTMVAPLMLTAWHTIPVDIKAKWLTHAPIKQPKAVERWNLEGSYRLSQAGHYLLSNFQDNSHSFIDQVTLSCSGTNWRDTMYEEIFTNIDHLSKKNSSDFVYNSSNNLVFEIPRKTVVQSYDIDAQRLYPNSLHHFVWILLNYKNYAHFKCSVFDMLTPKSQNIDNCGPESLNKYDIFSFLLCTAFTVQQNRVPSTLTFRDEPVVLPANITDLLCTAAQMKWWDCAYKLSQNELGKELTDIRSTLSRGLEVVRCIDNHGLDPELLCLLGRTFKEKAKSSNILEEKTYMEMRAKLYYSNAIPLLERLKNKISLKFPVKRMFEYLHKELSFQQIVKLIDESKMYVGLSYLNENDYEKAVELLMGVKSAQAFFHLGQIYKLMALDMSENMVSDQKSKYLFLLNKAKFYASKSLESFKDFENDSQNDLHSDSRELLESIETHLNRINNDTTNINSNDIDARYFSDENISSGGSDQMQITLRNSNSHVFRNLSSTPKRRDVNSTVYKSAAESQVFENTKIDLRLLERIDLTVNNFMEQTKMWIDENRNLGNQIMNSVNANTQSTSDQIRLLKLSIDHIKEQIGACRDECKDVGELKRQVAELKKEVIKLKKLSPEQLVNNENEYLNENYKSNDPTAAFTGSLPFTPPVLPTFNPRIMPPFPIPQALYGLYGQNLYNFYAQYPQFAQPGSVPGTSQMCDPTRSSVNYPGVYRPPEEIYSDMTHLIPPTLAPPVSVTAPVGPNVSVPVTKTVPSLQVKEKARSPPVNVVITSSDPLPMCTTAPPPILSVTIPPEHIKGTPHNYQITMPPTNDGQIRPPTFSVTPNKNATATAKTFPIWNPSTPFKSTEQNNTMPIITSVSESAKFPSLGSQKIGGLFTSSISDNLNTSNVSPDTSHNKSRTLSEKSNTSLDNYDPCPDFKPIIPLPDEVKVTTGEEEEAVVFCARAKLFRFVDKQWKERGIGEMKLLKHNITGKVRVLMRRDQVHKICANHIITAEMEIQPMKNESKAYFWVANDFADETVILEKFCIRFKTADIANEFYQAFLDAIKNSKSILNYSVTPKEENQSKTIVDKKNNITNQQNKTTVGGFTFNSTPTFKNINDSDKKENKSQEPKVTVINPFSNLSLKTANSSLSNILNSDQSKIISDDSIVKTDVQSKVNTSDTIDEFEPNIDFKPVIPLPPLIDHKTGEENETVIFEQRAKLLRFDAALKEWKECGLGNIKILVQKDNVQKVRLLMRREQVLIVCCNHALMTEMNFQKMPNVDKAVTWCAVDSSIGESMPQTFCLRFKTSQMCDDFINAVKSAQSKMVCNTKAAKEEQNATKHSNQIGFGDKFKPKPGSWFCDSCYTNNLDSFMTCACCENPNPLAKKPGSITSSADKVVSSWGDKFKPKSGSWECKICLVRNDDIVQNCSACNTPKDSTMPKNELKSIFGGNSKLNFSFGIPSQTDGAGDSNHDVQTSVGWGDKFKPKPGSWECEQCLIRNENNTSKCNACGSSKDSSLETKEQPSIFGNLSSVPKFVFGIPKTNEVSYEKPKSESLSIFDGSGTHKFTFGSQSMDISAKSGLNFKFGLDNKVSEEKVSDFGVPAITKSADIGVINFSMKKAEESKTPTTKPALLPTPQLENITKPTIPSFVPKEHNSFDFVLKSKTINTESPTKSTKNDESIENEYVSEDEGSHIHFSPVVPMPDKIEVFTGEENENELYAQRAKLFRFVGHEWKERGIGIVKILKHKETGKLRVVMRREQVLKICLNHALTNEITYVPKDQKTWLFTANDFSETVLTLQQFCLRFQTKEIAGEFKNAIANALEDLKCHDKKDSEDIVFVSETQSTPQEKQRAKELMLPENFFCYKNKDQCPGCRGCANDDSPVSNSQVCSTPIMTSSRGSPTTSIYRTPTTLNTTADSSIFCTPLETLDQNNQKSLLKSESSANSTFTADHKDDKESTSIIKSTLENMSSVLENISLDSTLASNMTQTPTGVKSSILAAPKLSSAGAEKKGETVKFPTFGNDQIKPSFSSVVDNKPPFSSNNITNNSLVNNDVNSENKTSNNNDGIDKLNLATTKSSEKNDDINESKIESKSIFAANKPGIGQEKIFGTIGNSKTGFVFGNITGSIFAPNSHNDNKTSTNENPVFGLGNKQWQFGSTNENKEDESKEDKETISQQSNEENASKTENNDKKDNIFKIDNSLSFAALSNSAPGFTQKKSDFSWEGAGQQIFGNSKRESDRDIGQDKDGEGEENLSTEKDNEEYDPHYEPIVSLPDVIVVTTGEEDEEKLFWERCKLYRYDENAKEWKERGVGEIKILYHPTRKSYRLLLRRELVHKLVLNMLLFADFGLLPMKNSDRAWTWAGRNYAENPSGDQELLAVRFKSTALAESFKTKVTECVKKLQANAAKEIRDTDSVKNNTESSTQQQSATSLASEPVPTKVGQQSTVSVTEVSDAANDSGTVLLRLPKHLTDSARVDSTLAEANLAESSKKSQGDNNLRQVVLDGSRLQVHFQEPAVEEEEEIDEVVGEEDDYEQNYSYYDDQQSIESTTFFTCETEVHIQQNDKETFCEQAQVQLFYCPNWYSPKIMVVDSSTGEILADMLIDSDSEFKLNEASVSWTGADCTSSDPIEKTVTLTFPDSDTATQFYSACEENI